jgi:hypothetical protein
MDIHFEMAIKISFYNLQRQESNYKFLNGLQDIVLQFTKYCLIQC